MTDFNPPSFNPKDTEYLAKLQDYYADWKSIPSYAKLCEVFGIASKSWVKAVLTRLNAAGFIERTPDGAWIPSRQFFARPLAESSVQAGMPASVTETQGEYFTHRRDADRHAVQHHADSGQGRFDDRGGHP